MPPGTTSSPQPSPPHVQLVQAQLSAITAWHTARRAAEAATRSGTASRERRLDLDRRTAARRREQAALVARADAHLRDSGTALEVRPRTRALIAHRSPWVTSAVAARLGQRGVVVVGVFEDGADAAGAVVVEQPDLVLVEDRLPSLTGIEVVRRVRSFSPGTVVGAQALDSAGVQPLVDAGAQAVFTKRVAPADVVDELLDCLAMTP